MALRQQYDLRRERRRGKGLAHAAESAAAWRDAMSAMLDELPEGLLMLDPALQVIHWNRNYAALTGLPPNMRPAGTTLQEVLRVQAEAGEFGLVDVGQEVALQLAIVRAGADRPPVLRHRPDGMVVELRHARLSGGGYLVRCRDVAARRPAPVPQEYSVRPAHPAALPPTLEQLGSPAGQRPRRCWVLLVEDMPVNQMVTATQLRREGHRVDLATTGAEAVRMAAVLPYDVVLMDLMMPGMSGYEAARRIRRLPPPAGQVPIHALTANPGEAERQRCLEAGMQGMLGKPVQAGQMAALLRQGSANAPANWLALHEPKRAAGGESLLDRQRLADLRRDLPVAALAALCEQCLADMAPRVATLQAALEQGAADDVAQHAHALAGMAASYGMDLIFRRMQTLLVATRMGGIAAAQQAGQGLAEDFARCQMALRDWLAAPVA